MHDQCCLVKVAMTLLMPFDFVWLWLTENRTDRDIEEQRIRLENLARKGTP